MQPVVAGITTGGLVLIGVYVMQTYRRRLSDDQWAKYKPYFSMGVGVCAGIGYGIGLRLSALLGQWLGY